MAAQANGNHREYQNDALYSLPKDTPEHERLDAQSDSLIALMNDRPFRAPVSNPKRILDIGCGTGSMTHLLGLKFPEAQVIGIDIAPVPESRHGILDNVQYVQGDILELIGKDPRFEADSFDYVFQRLLMFGVKWWSKYMPPVVTLVKPGGWLEAQEPSMQLRSEKGEPLADGMPWYAALRADTAEIGMDVEIGSSLLDHFRSTPGLEDVQESVYGFAPVPDEHTRLHALQGQIPKLFTIIVTKVCGAKRGEEEGEKLAQEMRSRWSEGFNKGDHFPLYAVTGRRKVD